MAGSQLTQLKSALTNAGLGRKSYSKKEKKAFKKGGARETDRAKTLQKLEDIKRGLNKFDHTETRLKHDVGGRQLKGVTGNPTAAKQAGLEKRRAQLLTEHQARDHRGTFHDRRFGESDPNMTVEDRMLERYTRERQRGQGKKGLFNLEEGEDDLDDLEEGNVLGGLTHGGRNVMDLPGDDFALQGLDDDEDLEERSIDRRTVNRTHFGGFQEPEEEEEPERKKSKQEVMAEVMAKSKSYKAERQHQNDLDADLRDELDGDMNDLRALLQEGPSEPASFRRQPVNDKEDAEYQQFVKSLAFEARAKPKDRTKTEDELAIEEKERLEKAEAKRLRRMRGEESEDEDSRGKKRKVDDRREGDDLGDDFIDEDEEDLLGPGLTREGLEDIGAAKAKALAEAGAEEEDGSDDGEDEDDEGDEEDEDEDDDEDDEDEDDDDEASEMEDLDEEADLAASDQDEIELVSKRKRKSTAKTTEIPYTFICPSSIDELEDIMEPLDDSAIPTVVQRIRAIHHPSLAQGNKEKLQEFFGVLLDYTLVLASRPVPAFTSISALTPHLIALVKLNPITAAAHFVGKVSLMQKNLSRGLARGATRLDSKTYPGAPELTILRLVGSLWSTSDFSHPVVAPSILLIGQYLGHGRLRRTTDIASGLMLCSLLLQYESESKRFLPEGVNFLAASILALLPRRKDSRLVTPFPNLLAPSSASSLQITAASEPSELADVSALLSTEGEQSKASLLSVALRLIESYAALYSASQAFIESFQPLAQILESSKTTKLSDTLKQRVSSTNKMLARMLNLAITSRQPMALQAHKPVPIASHAPRFEEGYAPGKRYDPDVERNAASKLKAQYKQERKGAIRELRKDNRFLAGEKAREQAEKDKEYNAKMRRAEGSITVERAEEKAMEREKAREKRRAGRG